MKRIYTFVGNPTTRNLTAADIRAGKGKRRFVQTAAVNRIKATAAEAIAELSPRTRLITHSIGSGRAADAIFLFQEDACGDTISPPSHAKAFADMAGARAALEAERAKGLAAYRVAVLAGNYPDAATSVSMKPGEHEKLHEALDKRRPFHS